MLTTDCMVAELVEEKPAAANPGMGGMGGMGMDM
jgi:chaperonin GroEL